MRGPTPALPDRHAGQDLPTGIGEDMSFPNDVSEPRRADLLHGGDHRAIGDPACRDADVVDQVERRGRPAPLLRDHEQGVGGQHRHAPDSRAVSLQRQAGHVPIHVPGHVSMHVPTGAADGGAAAPGSPRGAGTPS